MAVQHPTAFGHVLAAVDLVARGTTEIVVAGDRPDLLAAVAPRLPTRRGAAWGERYASPLWEGRDDGRAYVCQHYACQLPADDVDDAARPAPIGFAASTAAGLARLGGDDSDGGATTRAEASTSRTCSAPTPHRSSGWRWCSPATRRSPRSWCRRRSCGSTGQPPAGPGAELAYLRRTVINLSHGHHRHLRVVRRVARTERTPTATPPTPTPSAATTSAWSPTRSGPSPHRQRDCIVLRFYDDLTDTEIAETLGISAGSVKTHLHRARTTLADRLEALR